MWTKRLWIIQAKFKDGSWNVCNFTMYPFAFTNYYEAHKVKKEIICLLKQPYGYQWTKNKFRIVATDMEGGK